MFFEAERECGVRTERGEVKTKKAVLVLHTQKDEEKDE
jgi:hypothetical protein